MLSRRTFTALAGIAPFAGAVAAKAASFEGKTLRVQSWGGSDGLVIQKYIVDPFMKATGAKVVVEEGVTSASIAKVVAQKDDPQLDVVFLDDVGVFSLHRQGLLDQLDLSKIPNTKDVYPSFVLDDGYGIGFYTYITTLMYASARVKAPTSWNDLWDAKYKGRVLAPAITDTQALLFSVMAARLNEGDLSNLAPAWPKLQAFKPQVYSFIENRALDSQALNDGGADLEIDIPSYSKPYIDRGYKIAMTTDLKEGYFTISGAAVLVKDSKGDRDLAHAFINQALSPESQAGLANDQWYGPTNRKTQVSAAAAPYVVHTPEQFSKGIQLPRLELIEKRPEIVANWNKIFSG
jgi:putative spermidine/putrescine transport system substrate-binding protein